MDPLTIRKNEDNKAKEEEDPWANWDKNAEWDNQDEQPILNKQYNQYRNTST